MKKFLSGVLCTTLVFSLAISALAISGNVSFNLSAIKFDGQVISEAGEGYTLSNGCVAPASITYTDEKGGGTTYLPVRRIGELAGVTIDWDGAVVVKSKEFVEQEKREAERAAALDYSSWSAEDEAAYQEFKGMWELTEVESASDDGWIYTIRTNDTEVYNSVANEHRNWSDFALRLMNDINNQHHPECNFRVNFVGPDTFFFITMRDGIAY